MTTANRILPNILITGTPACGKSTLSNDLAAQFNLKWTSVSDLVKENNYYDEWDQERDCYVINEDQIVDSLDEQMSAGGQIIDYHGCDFFPERWFDLIIVLRVDTAVLHERLSARGYSKQKIDENIQCEIFQVLLDEARDAYSPSIVVELQNNVIDDLERITDLFKTWLTRWKESSSAMLFEEEEEITAS